MALKYRKVRVKVERPSSRGTFAWRIGAVIGSKSFVKNDKTPFDFITRDMKHNPVQTWNEDKLLIRLSNGDVVEAWDSEVYEASRMS